MFKIKIVNKKTKIIEYKLSKLLNWWLFWNFKSNFSWRWMEFDEHKNYSFWDSIKDIDWKASQKTWEIQVKKYEEERDLNILFLLDNSSSMQFWSEKTRKIETLKEVFYSIAISAYNNNDNIWALIFDEEGSEFSNFSKVKENIFRILDKVGPHLASPKGRGIKNNFINKIEKQLDILIKQNFKNNLIFILTDDSNFKNEKQLKLLWNTNEIIFINIMDNFENNLCNLDMNFSFNFWKNFLNIDLSNKEKTQKYKNFRQSKLIKFKERLKKNKTWYIYLDNKKDIFKELVKYFYKIK